MFESFEGLDKEKSWPDEKVSLKKAFVGIIGVWVTFIAMTALAFVIVSMAGCCQPHHRHHVHNWR